MLSLFFPLTGNGTLVMKLTLSENLSVANRQYRSPNKFLCGLFICLFLFSSAGNLGSRRLPLALLQSCSRRRYLTLKLYCYKLKKRSRICMSFVSLVGFL